MTIQMKALRKFKYAGKYTTPGERFDVRGRSDARTLAAIGHAELCTEAAPAPVAAPAKQPVARYARASESVPRAGEQTSVAAYVGANLNAEAAAEEAGATQSREDEAEQSSTRRRRTYRRRDMTAGSDE